MRLTFLTTLLVLLSTVVFSQDYILELEAKEKSEQVYSYQIVSVSDLREVQGDSVKLGIARVGAFNKKVPVYLDGGFGSIHAYLNAYIQHKENAEPVKMELTYLAVEEDYTSFSEKAVATVGFKLRKQDKDGWRVVFADTVKVAQGGMDVTTYLPDVTKLAFTTLLNRAQTSFPNWYMMVDGKPVSMADETTYYQPNSTKENTSSKPVESKKKDESSEIPYKSSLTVGYQVGGYTLIGVEADVRFSKRFAFNIGGGLAGFGLGMKYHFKKNSITGGYLCLNFKDGGFGLIQSVGPEIGTVIRLGKKERLGLMLQGGIHGITNINPEFEEDYYDNSAPDALISIGFGLTFAL